MELVTDLHSHSGYAGGVGQISLQSVAETMAIKGTDIFGTGDCLQPDWRSHLRSSLVEMEAGLFALTGNAFPKARFLLQTEIIITASIPSGGRKGVHTLLYFPSFNAVDAVFALMEKWEVKLGMGRPFLKCEDAAQVASRLFEIIAIDEGIEVIPAHVLTPQGIYGSDHPVDRLGDFFGEFAERIRAVETGLSADPEILALIPELDTRTLISNSDCHSPALHRVGRENTTLRVDALNYAEIIDAIRNGKVVQTMEFTPAEGRYFLTGHREGKRGHPKGSFCYFSPDTVPPDDLCPVCGKKLTVGVLQRALALSAIQGERRGLEDTHPKQKSLHIVPLVEVIAAGLGVKSASSGKVLAMYHRVIAAAGTEMLVWQKPQSDLESELVGGVPSSVIDAILSIRQDLFSFDPLGYDGTYGRLVVGRPGEWFGHHVIAADRDRE